MILRALAVAAVIALLAIGWLALNSEQSGPGRTAATAVAPPSPGYSARDAVLIETGADGLPMYTLRAAHVRQQPDSDVALLDEVQMQFRDAAGHVWLGHAQQARVTDQASQVDLSGDVTITGELPGNGRPAAISSERLSVDTRSEVVSTEDPVTLEVSGQQLHARGLIAQLREQRVELESDVHGRYVP